MEFKDIHPSVWEKFPKSAKSGGLYQRLQSCTIWIAAQVKAINNEMCKGTEHNAKFIRDRKKVPLQAIDELLHDLFNEWKKEVSAPPPSAIEVPKNIHYQIKSIQREIAMRKIVYSKKVLAKTMKKEDARHELDCMKEVLQTLYKVAGYKAPQITK